MVSFPFTSSFDEILTFENSVHARDAKVYSVIFECMMNDFNRSSKLNLLGDDLGLELLVSIGWIPILLAFLTHLVMVPGETPNLRATVRTPRPF